MLTRLGAMSLSLSTGVLLGSAALPAPAPAVPSALVSATAGPTAGPTAAAVSSAAADLAYVRWLSVRDPRQIVRTAAWTALISSAQERAIAQFLGSGFDSAKARAAATKARNLDVVKRILANTVAEAAPEVYAAARFAADGSDSDRAWFVQTGYALAKQRDRNAHEADGARQRALADADRAYVAALRDSDPGEQVRVSAAWATRPAATDADVVEFFAYGWLNGASLDLEVHRLRLADSNTAWRKTVTRLVAEAQAAERAALEAGEEAAAQARAAAARAWQAVGEQATPPRTAWAGAEAVSLEQAANWRAVVLAATAASGPNWEPVLAPATATEAEWNAETANAGEQAAFWAGLYEQALAGETRMTGHP